MTLEHIEEIRNYFLRNRGSGPFSQAHADEMMALCDLAKKAIVPEEGRMISVEMLNFLHGVGELENTWFGEPHPTLPGVYWWRRRLPDVVVTRREPQNSER